MTRRSGSHLALAAVSTAVLTAILTVGTPAGASTGDTDDRTPIAAVGQHLWPVDALDLSTVLVAAASAPTDATASPVAPVAVAPTPAAPATPAPAKPTPAPAPVQAEEPPVTTTGTIHVDATTTEGATRTLTLRSADGSLVAGPVTIDGNRITFTDLEGGTYDVLAEQVFDGGGSFVTRTVVDVAGGQTVVACHPETLDCTVS